MSFDHLTLDRLETTAVLTMDSGKTNALSPALIQELDSALHDLRGDSEITVLVITGGDSRFFSFGLDVAFLLELDRQDMTAFLKQLNALLRRLYTFPKPVVAAVNGHAMAGGLLLAMTADYRIGAEGEFSVSLSEVRLGLAAPPASIRMLARQVGHTTAQAVCFFGEIYTPAEAFDLDLYNELVPPEALQDRAREVASLMAGFSPQGIALNKRYLATGVFDIDPEQERKEDEAWLDAWFHPEGQARLRELAERK
jgi:enoyl-CoA hydratase